MRVSAMPGESTPTGGDMPIRSESSPRPQPNLEYIPRRSFGHRSEHHVVRVRSSCRLLFSHARGVPLLVGACLRTASGSFSEPMAPQVRSKAHTIRSYGSCQVKGPATSDLPERSRRRARCIYRRGLPNQVESFRIESPRVGVGGLKGRCAPWVAFIDEWHFASERSSRGAQHREAARAPRASHRPTQVRSER
jgi:hypothetical protein